MKWKAINRILNRWHALTSILQKSSGCCMVNRPRDGVKGSVKDREDATEKSR